MEKALIPTPFGDQELFRMRIGSRSAWVLFRHGCPHRFLPHQIPFRAQIQALQSVNCGALLVTSSVGVMARDIPLFRPMLVTDLLMVENRLPDGSACTMFPEPQPGQAHLVLQEGLFSKRIGDQIRARW